MRRQSSSSSFCSSQPRVGSAVTDEMAAKLFWELIKRELPTTTVFMSNAKEEIPESRVLSNRFPRRTGVGFLIISAALAKWQIYDPFHAAAEGRDRIWISGNLIGLSIILGLFGLALVIFGKKPNEWMKLDPKNIGWKQVAFYIAFALVGLGIFIWVDRGLAAQGYR